MILLDYIFRVRFNDVSSFHWSLLIFIGLEPQLHVCPKIYKIIRTRQDDVVKVFMT